MKSDNNIVNDRNVALNGDGTFTVFYGSEWSAALSPTGWASPRDGIS
jgi:hypothetical protein